MLNWLLARVGIEIVRRSLRIPLFTIAANAGVNASVVVEKVLEASATSGYDALNNVYVDMFEKGIIDPTKVHSHSRASLVVLMFYYDGARTLSMTLLD